MTRYITTKLVIVKMYRKSLGVVETQRKTYMSAM